MEGLVKEYVTVTEWRVGITPNIPVEDVSPLRTTDEGLLLRTGESLWWTPDGRNAQRDTDVSSYLQHTAMTCLVCAL